ncbi:glycosyltransferase [Pedobacter sp. Du54]|uniref:glycosyltransferase family 2 protein n=1 Tax=Pedobacter anseongensis TaxID=3133439 RepID=UPI0030A25F5F
MNTIALCIPAYNAAWCLPRLLESAKKQSIPFDEILVYNDCSTDDTAAVAEKYGAKVINGIENKGCSFGKNALAEIAVSEWIHFHDADDELLPNFMDVAQKWLEKEKDIILLNFEYIDFNTKQIIAIADYDREKLLRNTPQFVLQNKIVNFAICKKASFVKMGGFDLHPDVLFNEDRAFYVNAVMHNLTFDYEPVITCINYKYAQSMSSNNQLKCLKAYYNVSLKIANSLGKVYPKDLANGLWDNATSAASYQDWKLVKQNIALATKLNGRIPENQSTIVKLLSFINPMLSYWIREKLIRLIKPELRKINE